MFKFKKFLWYLLLLPESECCYCHKTLTPHWTHHGSYTCSTKNCKFNK